MSKRTEKTYSNTYVNFYVALTATSALFAGAVNPSMATWIGVFTGFSTVFWGTHLARDWFKKAQEKSKD